MPRYTASFAISCMTRQAFETLAAHLCQAAEVQDVRLLASFTGGAMLLECTASDRAALDAWMSREHLVPASVMRLDILADANGARLL